MNISEKKARRFSQLVVQLHRSTSETELLGIYKAALAEFGAGAQLPATARVSACGQLPSSLKGRVLLELIWEHFQDRCSRLLGGTEDSKERSFAATLLTPRERQVLARIALGNSDAAVGVALGITPKTVGKHVEHILAKLGVETRTAAAATILPRATPHDSANNMARQTRNAAWFGHRDNAGFV